MGHSAQLGSAQTGPEDLSQTPVVHAVLDHAVQPFGCVSHDSTALPPHRNAPLVHALTQHPPALHAPLTHGDDPLAYVQPCASLVHTVTAVALAQLAIVQAESALQLQACAPGGPSQV
jgi:hypothetical protein